MDWKLKIVCDPNVLMGKPTVKGTRLAVGFLLDLLAQGWSHDQIKDNYPQLTNEDIHAVLSYSAARIKDEETVPLKFGT
jgi:uncharacterized protein (DUF433 family)